ncbi:hypothetical protein [Aeromonas caviae]|uniref:hypothetical protein n=3 Tax=Aeromonas caviae TaxID=648 RepID=UPI001CC6D659|nr:hypothetical protein [Aeromonas caviae]
MGALELLQHCSELTPRSPVPWASAPATAAALRPTHKVMATARPRIKVTLPQRLGTWPSFSSAPPDPISHRPASHRPAGTRQIGAVTGWWWGPFGRLQHCSELTPSITGPQD